MKTCPKCGATYTDDLSFCLEDGTGLAVRPTAGLTNAPTEAYQIATRDAEDLSAAQTLVSNPNSPTAPKQFQMSAVNPSNRMGCVVTVGTVSALFLVVFGLGGAGIYSYLQTASDVAYVSNTTNARKPTNSAANSSSNAGSVSSNAIESNAMEPPPIPSATVNSNSKTVSGGVLNGKATSLPKPAYPPAARAVRAEGSVSVQVLVDESGSVVSASAVSGHPLLRPAATAAARGAKFSPTLLSGKPVKVSGVITYNFTL